jgi:hypothetical protein
MNFPIYRPRRLRRNERLRRLIVLSERRRWNREILFIRYLSAQERTTRSRFLPCRESLSSPLIARSANAWM